MLSLYWFSCQNAYGQCIITFIRVRRFIFDFVSVCDIARGEVIVSFKVKLCQLGFIRRRVLTTQSSAAYRLCSTTHLEEWTRRVWWLFQVGY